VKAKVRKEVEQLLETLPNGRTLRKLREEFERKGFLSKRELKVLESLQPVDQRAIA